jgi:hypothetical protein
MQDQSLADIWFAVIMALMEAPTTIEILIRLFNKEQEPKTAIGSLVKHSFTNVSY